MGLMTCPDCGKQVSARAPSCPSCGAPLGGAQPLGGTDQGTTTRPDVWHDPNVGCITAAIVLLVIIVLWSHGC